MTYIINFRTGAGSEYKTRRASYSDALQVCAQITQEGGTFVAVPLMIGGIPVTPADVAAYIQEGCQTSTIDR